LLPKLTPKYWDHLVQHHQNPEHRLHQNHELMQKASVDDTGTNLVCHSLKRKLNGCQEKSFDFPWPIEFLIISNP